MTTETTPKKPVKTKLQAYWKFVKINNLNVEQRKKLWYQYFTPADMDTMKQVNKHNKFLRDFETFLGSLDHEN